MGNDSSQFLARYDDLIQSHLKLTYAHISNPDTKDVVEYNHFREIFKYNYLVLTCHHIIYRVSTFEMNFITKAVKINTSLVILDLSQIHMNDDHLINLVDNGLKYSNTIRKLNLSNNDIKCKGIVSLCSFLFFNNKITKLDLSNNFFSSEGMKILGKMLEKNKTILDLNISGNMQTKSDNFRLGYSLEKNTTLLYFRSRFFSIQEIYFTKKVIERNLSIIERERGY